jgi:ubiquinone/menaquinone biosynthesis C-methylase UbiE
MIKIARKKLGRRATFSVCDSEKLSFSDRQHCVLPLITLRKAVKI